jgi:pimeloyl-ACP methyl ester carboxylesterase
LPAGHTTRDMADDYARWIDGRFQGPVDVFPDPIVRETAERIPQATLRRYEGVGHAVSKTHKRRFEDDVLGFLRG